MEEEKKDMRKQGDLMVNNLIYEQPKALSLAVNRTMKRQYFQQTDYSGGANALIHLNTGSDYLNCANSYLTFNVALTGTTPVAGFGTGGSALNFIERVTVTSRSGTELDRFERVNLYQKQNHKFTYSADWVTGFGSLIGYGGSVSSTATRFCIPLSMLSGFFKPTGGKLCPPQLASGLQIEIAFADYRTAVDTTSGTVTGYNITDISIMADLVTLSDNTQRTLNVESTEGLKYTYDRVYTSTAAQTTTSVNAQIRKAVSMCNSIKAVIINSTNLIDVTADSLACINWNYDEWSFRLGGLYFPSQPIKNASDGVESLFQVQACYDKPRHSYSESAVSLTDFTTGGFGMAVVCFEKDQALNMSGLPVNNSRVAEFNGTLSGAAATNSLVTFLEYTSVCRAYVDNVVVSV